MPLHCSLHFQSHHTHTHIKKRSVGTVAQPVWGHIKLLSLLVFAKVNADASLPSVLIYCAEVSQLHTYVFPCCSFEVLLKVIECLEPVLFSAKNAFSFYYRNHSTVRQKILHVNPATFVWWVLAHARKA